jgi:hypothetical protein
LVGEFTPKKTKSALHTGFRELHGSQKMNQERHPANPRYQRLIFCDCQ